MNPKTNYEYGAFGQKQRSTFAKSRQGGRVWHENEPTGSIFSGDRLKLAAGGVQIDADCKLAA